MKIAIFHNYMDNIGGAEIVALILARELKADIYTTNISAEKIEKMGFVALLPSIFSIGKIPKKAPFRQQLALLKFRRLNLKNKYDFYIIAGDWSISSAVNNKPNLWYVHSPLNELWAFKNQIKKDILKLWQKPIFEAWVILNRFLTKKYAKHVQVWVCNSENTKNRIRKYYHKEAEVINPPIETKKLFYKKNKNFWLSVNRLSKAKRVGMQLEAFKLLKNEKLFVVGSYEKGVAQFEKEKQQLFLNIPENVEIKSWVSHQELLELYANCKGFITTSLDEDFGMSAVEAMASGKPVIAPNDGGYKESIINNKTGILIDSINPQKIADTVKTLNKKIKENQEEIKKACQEQAKKFDTEIFSAKIKGLIGSDFF